MASSTPGDRNASAVSQREGTGNVAKGLPPGIREHHGKYQVRYYGSDGRERTKSFRLITDAKKFKAAVATDKERGVWIDPRKAQTPFDQWAQTWFASRHKLGDAKRSTNESVLRLHVIGTGERGFGSIPLGRITPLEVQQWVDSMIAAGYSPSYVRGAFTMLSGILRAGVAARLILEAPSSGIELPKMERKRERFLTEVEIDRLVEQFAPLYRPLVLTAAWTGCRWGELVGLRREHLDLEQGKMQVRSVLTLVLRDGKLVVGPQEYPKSDAGKRTIGLPQSLTVALRAHLDAAPEGEYVFTTPRGDFLRASNFRRREWSPAVRAGQPGATHLPRPPSRPRLALDSLRLARSPDRAPTRVEGLHHAPPRLRAPVSQP